ncbi:RNA-binding protein PNO1 [Zalerion maritima]|uniref:Pre-rRNA-processing protein PNO1 n=1 Tax=Zalerion maritima TaxID=339359 RepID=A0AAD5S3I7_9PEZI|nr:RNA-binding protein PNO1 [Zalerion maritima]
MPAPTARAPTAQAAPEQVPLPIPDEIEELESAALVPLQEAEGSSPIKAYNGIEDVDMTAGGNTTDLEGRPSFPSVADSTSSSAQARRLEKRKIPIPPHRMSPLKREWPQIYPPLIEHLKLQVRMNPARKLVELRTSKTTPDGVNALQKGEDFVRACAMGFEVADAIALLRMDDLYTETFEIKDVKTLQGDHLGRAIGRIAGQDGKTKLAIENASRTRVVLADSKIHILGRFKNIHMAREAIVDLILGKQPSKVYGNLQRISKRMKESF